MKKGRFLAIMLCCFTIGACTACAPGNKEPEKDTFPYHVLKSDRKTDGQYYGGNGVNLPAALWQTPAAERYEALDRNEVKAVSYTHLRYRIRTTLWVRSDGPTISRLCSISIIIRVLPH